MNSVCHKGARSGRLSADVGTRERRGERGRGKQLCMALPTRHSMHEARGRKRPSLTKEGNKSEAGKKEAFTERNKDYYRLLKKSIPSLGQMKDTSLLTKASPSPDEGIAGAPPILHIKNSLCNHRPTSPTRRKSCGGLRQEAAAVRVFMRRPPSAALGRGRRRALSLIGFRPAAFFSPPKKMFGRGRPVLATPPPFPRAGGAQLAKG